MEAIPADLLENIFTMFSVASYRHTDHVSEAESSCKLVLLPTAAWAPAASLHLAEETASHIRPSTQPRVQSHPASTQQNSTIYRSEYTHTHVHAYICTSTLCFNRKPHEGLSVSLHFWGNIVCVWEDTFSRLRAIWKYCANTLVYRFGLQKTFIMNWTRLHSHWYLILMHSSFSIEV